MSQQCARVHLNKHVWHVSIGMTVTCQALAAYMQLLLCTQVFVVYSGNSQKFGSQLDKFASKNLPFKTFRGFWFADLGLEHADYLVLQ